MQHLPLGRTGIMVSELCLGTMTWGTQNTQPQAHQQMAMALDHGVNFWDTAEMYPVNPVSADTVGNTEAIIGTWFADQPRDKVVLASKVAGGGNAALRAGAPLTGASFRAALDASLRRLNTDYIDLYQIHWPNRSSYHFRKNWNYHPKASRDTTLAHMTEVLAAAQDAVAQGKIRALGISNETVWGAAQWLRLADAAGLPRMASIQNEYSLLCRQFDTDWAELSVQEDLPLLAFSPLACGLLSGKYAGDVIPEGTRRAIVPSLSGRITPQVFPAVAAYLGLAAEARLDPNQMALAFCRARPFPCIPIIGATTLAQLKVNLGSAEVTLSPEVLEAIDALHRAHPAPF
ncbi:aldo/keto reductase [Rhodobacter ferrooxidans]|uniref:Aldo/keto reductase n=1 Tax=Rhodobacter ferrooxidans TaxID=371731 RepID=C8S044_9RHOB|nr:aldo/keto reductase [Rhodobacter sp. SW2]EEW25653.1 aldo/keto reductase [Rhodobacter sp. SW2]